MKLIEQMSAAVKDIVCIGKSHHCFMNAEGRPIALSKQYPEYDALLKLYAEESNESLSNDK